MPSDLDAMIADVLAKHAAGITPLPWQSQHRSSSYIDVHSQGKKTKDCGPSELAFVPICRVHIHADGQANLAYLVAAANAAPVLARELKRCREALRKIEQHDGGACGCSTARAALAPEESTHDQ